MTTLGERSAGDRLVSVIGAAARSDDEERARLLALIGAGLAGILACAASWWAVSRSSVIVSPESTALFRSADVALLLGVGIYTWWRRPRSRLGLLLVAAGFLYAATSLNASASPVTHTVGMVVWQVLIVYTAYLYLCFPDGRLGGRWDRPFLLACGGVVGGLWLLAVVAAPTVPTGGPWSDCGGGCPANGLQVFQTSDAFAGALNNAVHAALAVLGAGAALLVLRKARHARRLRRRAVMPLGFVLIADIAVFVAFTLAAPWYPGLLDPARTLHTVLTLAVPVAFLAGQIRGSMFAARSVARLVAESAAGPIAPSQLQILLREALGDPTLELAFWSTEHEDFLGIEGASLELPDLPDRAMTSIGSGALPSAAILHDPALDERPETLEALAMTAWMLLENSRLVEELRASRARIVATAENERLRLERDLHDGAQQRLLSLQIKVGLARRSAADDGLAAQIDEIARDATAAVQELRELAHGIYPTTLHERGLPDALRSHVVGMPTPVTVVADGIFRLPVEVEAAVYYCTLEAIQNAVKHGGAGVHVSVTLSQSSVGFGFEIADDGAGFTFDTHEPGMGLTTMRDRIGAVGGDLTIISTPDRGTAVRGFIPDANAGTVPASSAE